jgi:hypothetical protein
VLFMRNAALHPRHRLRVLLLTPVALVLACAGIPGAVESPVASPGASVGPAASRSPTTITAEPAAAATLAARQALAQWLGPVGDQGSIVVRSAEAVEWSNGCLEVMRARRACSQLTVRGYRVDLVLGRATYEVRTDATGTVAVWAPGVQILTRFVERSPNFVVVRTDDGGTIEAQVVPGSDIAIDLARTKAGDPVAVALVEAPQREGQLLLWLDPVGP